MVTMTLKVKDLIHNNNNFAGNILPKEQAIERFFNDTLRKDDLQNTTMTITLLAKITELNSKSTYDFRRVFNTFSLRNGQSRPDPSGKARRFYHPEHPGNMLGSTASYIISQQNRPQAMKDAVTILNPVADHQYWPARAIALADVENMQAAVNAASLQVTVSLRLLRYMADTADEYWLATIQLPDDYPTLIDDYTKLHVRWSDDKDGSLYPKSEWPGSIIGTWRAGAVPAGDISVKLTRPRRPDANDEGDVRLAHRPSTAFGSMRFRPERQTLILR